MTACPECGSEHWSALTACKCDKKVCDQCPGAVCMDRIKGEMLCARCAAEHDGVRPEFAAIVSGWTLIDGMDDITDRIEQAAKWTNANGPLLPDEEATVRLMIKTQIARGIRQGDFAPFINPGDEDILL